MTTAAEIAHALGGKKNGSGWSCHCPAHDDRNASCSVGEADDGKILVHCHAGCDQTAVINALRSRGLWHGGKVNGAHYDFSAGQKTKSKKAKKPFTVIAVYRYTDESGNPLFEVCRLDPKDFRQRRPNGEWSTKGIRQVPYNLQALIAAKGRRVFFMEGEKDCNLATSLGLTATTNPGGAGKWRPEYAQYFETDDVIIIADNDNAGRDHAQCVAASLAPVAAKVRILDLPDIPEKGDFTDWFGAGRTFNEFEALIAAAPIIVPPDGPCPSSEDEYADYFSGLHAESLRYVALWNSWLQWNGAQWKTEKTLEAFNLARLVARRFAKLHSSDADIAKASVVAAIERLGRADRRQASTTDQWDVNGMQFNIQRGEK